MHSLLRLACCVLAAHGAAAGPVDGPGDVDGNGTAAAPEDLGGSYPVLHTAVHAVAALTVLTGAWGAAVPAAFAAAVFAHARGGQGDPVAAIQPPLGLPFGTTVDDAEVMWDAVLVVCLASALACVLAVMLAGGALVATSREAAAAIQKCTGTAPSVDFLAVASKARAGWLPVPLTLVYTPGTAAAWAGMGAADAGVRARAYVWWALSAIFAGAVVLVLRRLLRGDIGYEFRPPVAPHPAHKAPPMKNYRRRQCVDRFLYGKGAWAPPLPSGGEVARADAHWFALAKRLFATFRSGRPSWFAYPFQLACLSTLAVFHATSVEADTPGSTTGGLWGSAGVLLAYAAVVAAVRLHSAPVRNVGDGALAASLAAMLIARTQDLHGGAAPWGAATEALACVSATLLVAVAVVDLVLYAAVQYAAWNDPRASGAGAAAAWWGRAGFVAWWMCLYGASTANGYDYYVLPECLPCVKAKPAKPAPLQDITVSAEDVEGGCGSPSVLFHPLTPQPDLLTRTSSMGSPQEFNTSEPSSLSDVHGSPAARRKRMTWRSGADVTSKDLTVTPLSGSPKRVAGSPAAAFGTPRDASTLSDVQQAPLRKQCAEIAPRTHSGRITLSSPKTPAVRLRSGTEVAAAFSSPQGTPASNVTANTALVSPAAAMLSVTPMTSSLEIGLPAPPLSRRNSAGIILGAPSVSLKASPGLAQLSARLGAAGHKEQLQPLSRRESDDSGPLSPGVAGKALLPTPLGSPLGSAVGNALHTPHPPALVLKRAATPRDVLLALPTSPPTHRGRARTRTSQEYSAGASTFDGLLQQAAPRRAVVGTTVGAPPGKVPAGPSPSQRLLTPDA
eukprot:TRINITY_DN14245_c0_g4_i1.p1 TRINITY_DN14245_c0_g4~~TRINITY_DN14245_c0_g4_i1.p1  ORF type:complete len:843 (+),score=238.58 TRINITY_DN14245_c0_g4_i1:55-2583(+)